MAEPLRSALSARAVPPPRGERPAPAATALQARAVTVRYGEKVAVRDVSLALDGGQVVALMGRNGSGKSSLMWALQGSGPSRRAG